LRNKRFQIQKTYKLYKKINRANNQTSISKNIKDKTKNTQQENASFVNGNIKPVDAIFSIDCHLYR
jgi:hypothetical protein